MADKSNKIPIYSIQKWLFDKAEGKYEIDLAESGIQFHYLNDLSLDKNYDLNYSLDKGKYKLRKIIADIYNKKTDNVIITNGGQEALFLIYQTLLNKDDEVITFTPGWQQSWEVPKLIGCKVIDIKLLEEENYRINFDKLVSVVSEKTKLIVLNSPHNPTGTIISPGDWEKIESLSNKFNFYTINDEEYLTDYSKSIVNKIPKSISVSSLSKVYGFPGLRIGWAVASKDVVDDLINFKRYTTVSNSSLCEYLAIQVLGEYKSYIEDFKLMVNKGFSEFKKWVGKYPNLKYTESQNTPFVYLRIEENSQEMCEQLLEKKKVLLMPAEVFGDEKAIRLSFARPLDILREGLKRIGDFIDKK